MQLKLPQLETAPENATVGQRPWIRAQVVTRIHWAWIQANPVRCVLKCDNLSIAAPALSLHGSRPRPLATGSRPWRRRGGGAKEAAAIAIPADEDSCKGPPSGARGAPDVETKGLYSTHDLAPHQADTASFFG